MSKKSKRIARVPAGGEPSACSENASIVSNTQSAKAEKLPPNERKRIHWMQAIVGAVIGLALGFSSTVALKLYYERGIAYKVLRHTRIELASNMQAVQLRGAAAFGLVTDPPKDQASLNYRIAMLKLPVVHQMVPTIWGSQLTALHYFGQPGRDAYLSIVSLYTAIKKVESDEANILELLDKETDIGRRRKLFEQLHEVEDELRRPIAIASERLSHLPRE